MSKILAVFGATGQQGGSIVNHVLNDPELSATYTIRAITRDSTSAKALQLAKQQGVQVVAADISDPASLLSALTGAHTVFIMTPPSSGLTNFETELAKAKTMADAAVEAGVGYIIFSTLPSVTEISGGKYTKVFLFDAKAAAEVYIRTLPVKSAFVSLGGFMENFRNPRSVIRRTGEDGSVILARHDSPNAKFPLVAAAEDTGKFVGAILAEPEKFEGRRIEAAVGMYSWEDVAEVMTMVMGTKVVYRQVPVDEFKQILPPTATDVFVEAYSYSEEFGYFGRNTEDLVEKGSKITRGKSTTLEEWLKAHPLECE
ncbi:hypothetical protein GE09DRAFT_1219582 [Coniochaeta sp. 2T2.1]|nr:hypothetical protein GE09DRAFT_1219582 [Coniochaeta sp. 2T2.1]